MRKTFEKYSLKLGILAILLVSVFSWQSCKKDEAPAYPPNLENKEVVSPTEIQFTFSKEMDKTTGENVSTYKFEPSVEISKAVVNGKVITLTLAKPLNGGQYKVKFDNLKSSDGGVFPYEQMLFLDYTAPKFESVEVVSAKEVKFVFTEEIQKASGENLVVYKFTPNIEVSKAVVEGKEVMLTLSELLEGGVEYSVVFENLYSEDGGIVVSDQPVKVVYTSVWQKQTNLHVPFANGNDPNTWTFFSLKDNKVVNLDLASVTQSKEWDIAFVLDGGYMTIYANGKCGGAMGDGSVSVEKKSVEAITKIDEQSFVLACAMITAEIQSSPDIGSMFGHAWCEKDAENIYDYSVQNDPLIPFRIPKERTIVFKTAEGKYGKLQIQSIYKETPPNPLPADYDQYYLTFRYVIQENGKNELDIPIDVE